MKTRVLVLTAFLALGAGCKGNGDSTKAVSPNQIGQVGQLNQQEYRQRSSLSFLDDSHELRDLKIVNGTDPRILSARLITRQGYRGSSYDLKVVMRGSYNQNFAVRQIGTLVPRGDQAVIDLLMPNQIGAMILVGELASIEEVSSNDQCAFLRVNFAHAMIGETRLLLCEESHLHHHDDEDDYEREHRRRRNY